MAIPTSKVKWLEWMTGMTELGTRTTEWAKATITDRQRDRMFRRSPPKLLAGPGCHVGATWVPRWVCWSDGQVVRLRALALFMYIHVGISNVRLGPLFCVPKEKQTHHYEASRTPSLNPLSPLPIEMLALGRQ